MTIKGTLETFNLRELLQMLAFNQKVGTLVLETERGPRTIYVEKGRVAFLARDPLIDAALLKILKRGNLLPEDRLERAVGIQQASGRHLIEVLPEMGVIDAPDLEHAGLQAVGECFLTLQLTSVSQFEFMDGQALAPDGSDSQPLGPWMVVDSLLLDLTRKMDQWAELSRTVPGLEEIYELSGLQTELDAAFTAAELDPGMGNAVYAAFDGFRTLAEVADASFVDELTAMQAAAVCLQSGTLRPVATQDLAARGEGLLARGEAKRALPLLTLSVEREDAVHETRLRMADALEDLGRPEEAALQLDRFSALGEDSKPREVFDALYRALSLRAGDPATAARLCDYYLRNRPWLADERRAEAVEALRTLIHAAVTERRPREAAVRLDEFIRLGDAPSEDQLVLADLYAAAGESRKAAGALYVRAEELLDSGRKAAGRDLLGRTLQLDPSRADARSQLHALDGATRKRRRRRRVVVFLVLLVLLIAGAATAWYAYAQQAARAVAGVRQTATQAVEHAHSRAEQMIEAFRERVDRAADAAQVDAGLAEAAETLRSKVEALAHDARQAVQAYEQELAHYPPLAHSSDDVSDLHKLEGRRQGLVHDADRAVQSAVRRGRKGLDDGERMHKEGRFREARAHLVTARNLALDDVEQTAHAEALLKHVDRYVEAFETTKRQMDKALARGSVEEAFRIGTALLTRQLESDLTRGIRLAVHVDSSPPGARLVLAGRVLEDVTPCVVSYSPFSSDTRLHVRMPGRIPRAFDLPTYDALTRDDGVARGFAPQLVATLQEGPCWRVQHDRGPFRDAWVSGGIPTLLSADGNALQTIEPEQGILGLRRAISLRGDVRTAGCGDGQIGWYIAGQRTLGVKVKNLDVWEASALAHLVQPPSVADGILVVVDERGQVYGYASGTGNGKWSHELHSRPSQPPLASARGVLIGTHERGVALFEPRSGRVTRLPIAAQGFARAAPFGDGILVLGGDTQEIRVVSTDDRVHVRGQVRAEAVTQMIALPEGAAWIENGRVRWLALENTAAPVEVRGLPGRITHLSGGNGHLYATASDGFLYAVDLLAPARTAWRSPIGGTALRPPLVLPNRVLLVVDGGVVAFTR